VCEQFTVQCIKLARYCQVLAPPRTQVGGGEPHSLAVEAVAGRNSDEWTNTVVLCREIPLRPSSLQSHMESRVITPEAEFMNVQFR
jgi:hypothetical protein